MLFIYSLYLCFRRLRFTCNINNFFLLRRDSTQLELLFLFYFVFFFILYDCILRLLCLSDTLINYYLLTYGNTPSSA